MKPNLLVVFLLIISASAYAQQPISVTEMKPQYDAGQNISQRLFNDSNLTSTIIWIKETVEPHFHHNHSEQMYVLEGEGLLLLNDSNTVYSIKAGDLIQIPQNVIHAVKVTSKIPMKVISFHAPEYDGLDKFPADVKW